MNTAKVILFILAVVATVAGAAGWIAFEQAILAWMGFVAGAWALQS